jgi:peptide subunit release factor 1 (eRF1)
VEETLESVQEGRAELLLVSMGKKERGWKCENCKTIGMGEAVKCGSCGRTVYTVDVVEEMIELAEQMGTTVEFVKDNEFLEELGGVAAFLRF